MEKIIETNTNKGEVLLYKNRVEVKLEEDTVWLSQAQMCTLFDKDKRTVSEHIRNLFREGELRELAVVRNSRTTASDGKQYLVTYYNLDVIISVGYRVKSKQGTQFRIWATQVLRKHLVDGYTLNEKRLKLTAAKYQELQNAIALIGNVTAVDGLSLEAKGIAQVISEYSRALDILDDFDHERLAIPLFSSKKQALIQVKQNQAH